MADDPLFDPWSSEVAPEPGESSQGPDEGEPEEPRRERSKLADDAGERTRTADDRPRAPARPSDRSPRWSLGAGDKRLQRRHPPPQPPAAPARPRRTGTADLAERLGSLAMPLLEDLSARLTVARHRTLLDDRLAKDPPRIRFRLMPWQAPFDEPTPVAGSVLELLARDGREVVARLWLDPLAETPTEESTVPSERLGEAWLDGVMMDFVERALSQS